MTQLDLELPQSVIRQGLSIVPKSEHRVEFEQYQTNLARQFAADVDHECGVISANFTPEQIAALKTWWDSMPLGRLEPMPLKSHRNDPHTSVQAAESAAGKAQHMRTATRTALRLYGPQTSHEIAARMGCHWSDVARRITELIVDGKVAREQTGTYEGRPIYRTRLTPSGKPACVYHCIGDDA